MTKERTILYFVRTCDQCNGSQRDVGILVKKCELAPRNYRIRYLLNFAIIAQKLHYADQHEGTKINPKTIEFNLI